MSHKLPITALIATRNEEANIRSCLSSLNCASQMIVVDSKSEDRTVAIAKEMGAEVVPFVFRGGYPKKRQWALDTRKAAFPWILLVDADERVPEALWVEIENAIKSADSFDAFFVTKGFHFLGRRFRFGGFSHSAVILFRAGKARFEKIVEMPGDPQDMEVHERVIVEGRISALKTPLIHEDFKGLPAYIDRHNKYSSWEAFIRHEYQRTGRYGQETVAARLFGNAQERRRFLKMIAVRMPFEPWLWFLYHYVLRAGFLEGRPGLIASRLRAAYIQEVLAKMYELGQKRRA